MRRCSRDSIVFAAATAVVALHALTDAAVAPEAGTGAADHLLPLAATLSALGLAVAAFPRVRAGARAALALVLGALSLEGFAITVAGVRATGVHGDAWTGFLLLPAGAALCGLGALLLWRSRRAAGHRVVRRALRVAAAAVLAYFLVLPAAIAILATHRPREAEEIVDLGRPAVAAVLTTSDGLALRARYVPSRNGAAVIVYPASASRAPQARMLVRHGFGVLMLEMRGYAGSEGAPNMFGWGAARDVDAAVAFLQRRPDVTGGRIGGLGFSVGGEQMLEAAASNTALRAVVSDGAGERSVRESVLRGPAGWISLPAAVLQTAAVAVLSGRQPPPALSTVIGRIAPRPLFLVYAGRGAGGEDLQPRYYAAARPPKCIWLVPGAPHTGGYAARPLEYERRVTAFFDRSLARVGISVSADVTRGTNRDDLDITSGGKRET